MLDGIDIAALRAADLASAVWAAAVLTVMVDAIRRAERWGLDGRVMFWTGVWGLVGAWIGGYWYCLLDTPARIAAHPLILVDVLGSEKAFFGALAGAGVGGMGYLLPRCRELWPYVEAAVPAGALGYAIFRIGCLLNGCEIGSPTDLAWAISGPEGVPRHPIAIYHGVLGLGVYLLVRNKGLWFKSGRRSRGRRLAWALGTYGAVRFALEFLRVEPVSWWGLHVGHWFSLVLLVGAVTFLAGDRLRRWSSEPAAVVSSSLR